ncbi:MFS transporter [Thermodesulfobacteriota bacterium]
MHFDLRIFITLFLAVFVTTMGAGVVAPLLPVYAHELGAGAFQVGLIFGAFSITRSLFVPYFGGLSDRRGKKPLLTVGLFCYCIISIFYFFADSVWSLVTIRLGHGFASAMILPVAQAYVGLIVPKSKEGRMMGLFNVALYGGLSFGPVLGGVVKDLFSIKLSFLSMGGLSLAGFLLCLILLPSEKIPEKKELHTDFEQTKNLGLLRDPAILALFTFRASFTTAVGIVWAFLPLVASTKLNLSSSAIGVVVMTNVFVAGLLQAPMGYMADRYSKSRMVTAGGILAIISMLYINWASSFAGLIVANGLLGIAGGISFPAVMAIGVIEGRRLKAMGSLMGLLALSHSIGMLAGPLIGGVFIDLFSSDLVFIMGAAFMAVGLLIFIWRH